jgi:hypothetical protein
VKDLQYFDVKFRLGIVCLITCPTVIFLLFCDHTWVFARGHCGPSNGIIISIDQEIS